jgi:signal transduction histidine kinase
MTSFFIGNARGLNPRAWRVPLRDAAVVVTITACSAWLFGRIELSERVFAATRPWEFMQLDEIPAVLLVLAICLVWYAGRRFREASAELARRTDAERQMKELLEDNRRLARQHIDALESERKRLARELHDEAGQYLNAIKTDAVSILGSTRDEAADHSRAASAIIEHTDRVYGVVRDLIRQLRPVGLDVLGLVAACREKNLNAREAFPPVIDAVLDTRRARAVGRSAFAHLLPPDTGSAHERGAPCARKSRGHRDHTPGGIVRHGGSRHRNQG